jgi:hypothetical protein
MGSGRELVKYEARRKGVRALMAGTSTVLLAGLVVPAVPLFGAFLVLGGGAITAARTWDWLKYRGTWGLKF